jgi:hypothetical protein
LTHYLGQRIFEIIFQYQEQGDKNPVINGAKVIKVDLMSKISLQSFQSFLRLIYCGSSVDQENFVFRLMNILGDDQLHRENISIFLTHALGQRTVTKNAECHNHSQIELMLNKSALSVFSNWAPQKQFHQVTDEVNIKRQRD